ncbi:MAG: LytR/AlgR family response regulator transcription factor [Eubacteriaceae bacterium]
MNIIICDDEQGQREKYKKQILALCQEKNITPILKVFESGKHLLFEAEDILNEIDLIYMDINMPGEDGVAIAERLRQIGFLGEIVFLTVVKHRVFEAFDVDAMHYIVKEVTSPQKFKEIFYKAVKKVEGRNQEVAVFTCAGETRTIPITDIRYFIVNKNIITVHYKDKTFEFYSTLGKLEELLFNKGFCRIHRTMLIALKEIAKLSYLNAILVNGEEIPVGRKYYKEIKKLLD